MSTNGHDRSNELKQGDRQPLDDLVARIRSLPLPEESIERVRRFAARLDSTADVSTERRRWRRAAWGSVMAATALTLAVAVLIASSPKRLSAMERMADQLAFRRSFSLKMVQRLEVGTNGARMAETVVRAYFQPPHTYRLETKSVNADLVDVRSSDRAGILIDHQNRNFQKVPIERGTQGSPLMMFENLAKYRGKADRELGEKQIDGQTTQGFVLVMAKIDPDVKEGNVEIWIDAKTSLPLEIRYRFEHLERTVTIEMTEFVWDATLDPKLFEPTPPAGYVDFSPKESTTEEQFQKIREAMSLYAELSGGHYPKVKAIYGDMVSAEMRKLAGLEKNDAKTAHNPMFKRIMEATSGLAAMTLLQRQNEEAVYNGMSVGPKDRDKVLFRWKLADGRFAVLFGDLESEIVDKERLISLEKPSP